MSSLFNKAISLNPVIRFGARESIMRSELSRLLVKHNELVTRQRTPGGDYELKVVRREIMFAIRSIKHSMASADVAENGDMRKRDPQYYAGLVSAQKRAWKRLAPIIPDGDITPLPADNLDDNGYVRQ